MKIGFIIPSTSNKRNWINVKESYLYKHTMKSFLLTYDKEHEYTFYIGIDRGDSVYDSSETKEYMENFCSLMKGMDIQFIYMDGVKKGHLTVMWNKLFTTAYDDNCDYFFQCGDDIEFKTGGWINKCIEKQLQHNNVGVTGPIDMNNTRLLTQSFVSRKHMDMFGYYFPPEIINWFCDDWINEVYIAIQKFYPLKTHVCINVGGDPRYDINNDIYNNQRDFNNKFNIMRNNCTTIVKRDVLKISSKNKQETFNSTQSSKV